jgi:hypothetical protein
LWSWGQEGESALRLQKNRDGREGEVSLALVSSLPAVVAPDTLLKWLIVILAVAILLALVYLLVRFVARHFFLLDQDAPRPLVAGQAEASSTRNLIVLRPPAAFEANVWDPQYFHRIDLSRVASWQDWADTIKSNAPAAGLAVILDHFERSMDDPISNRQKLEVIERFLSDSRRVVVISTVDPLRFSLAAAAPNSNASSQGAAANTTPATESAAVVSQEVVVVEVNKPPAQTDSAISLQARWSEAFSSFATVHEPDNASAHFMRSNADFLDTLKTNRPWRYLETIGKEIGANGAPEDGKRRDRAATEEWIGQVVDQARAYHQALWATCSQDDRYTLIHLALDGMVSSKNADLRQLMKRGLVVRDPALRLMDESFRRFVISAARGKDIDSWRQSDGSTWELMKAPLLLILLSVALFLFVTQKEMYNSTLSFVSALTAGLAALFKLLGMFQKGKDGSAIQS